MRFHVWPAYFREAAEVEMHSYLEIIVFFCLSIAFGFCAWLFGKNTFGIFLLLSFLSFVFALTILKKYLYDRKYIMLDVYIDNLGIQILDYKSRTKKSIEYGQINAIETRVIDIDANVRYNHLYEYLRHRIIFIYINDVRCFQDLHLETYKSNRTRVFADHYVPNCYDHKLILDETSEDPKYWGVDIFSNPNCVALAFNEDAWNLLHKYYKKDEEMGRGD